MRNNINHSRGIAGQLWRTTNDCRSIFFGDFNNLFIIGNLPIIASSTASGRAVIIDTKIWLMECSIVAVRKVVEPLTLQKEQKAVEIREVANGRKGLGD